MKHCRCGAVGCVVFASVCCGGVQGASFQGLGDLPGGPIRSVAYAVSGDGQVVVGDSDSALRQEAFRWTAAGGLVPLGAPPGEMAYAMAAWEVNQDGSVIAGFLNTDAGQHWTADRLLRWTSTGGSQNLGYPPEATLPRSFAMWISADGSLIGAHGNYGPVGGYWAFSWNEAAGYARIDADLPGGLASCPAFTLSRDGQILAGGSHSDAGYETYRYHRGTGTLTGVGDLPGGLFESAAYGLSADGSVMVGFGHTDAGREAYRWTPATGMQGLGDLPGGAWDSWAEGVSADGEIVVGWGTSDAGSEAFIWDRIHGMRRLADVLSSVYGLNLEGWVLSRANAVSDDGRTIVGAGRNPAGAEEGWIAVIDSLPLGVGAANGCPGTTVSVPITARGFVGIGSLQFTVAWDPAVAAFAGVQQFGLPDLGADNFGQPAPGRLTFAWEDVSLLGTTVMDGTTVFVLRLTLVGPQGAGCAVSITDQPCVAEAATGDFQTLEIIAGDGRVEVIDELTIDGTVAYYVASRPVAGVSVLLTGGETQTAVTDPVGHYLLTVAGCTSYLVRPEKPTHTPPSEGVTAADVLALRRHILGIEPLSSPFTLLAGDADASRSITSIDLRLLRQLILDLRSNLPGGLWRFLPVGYAFPDPAAPWNAPRTREYPDLAANSTGQDYTAIKIGDANGSWTAGGAGLAGCAGPGVAPRAGSQPGAPVVLKVASASVTAGEPVALTVVASAAGDLTSLQFTLAWDPDCLRFLSVGNAELPGLDSENFGTHRTAEGRLMFAWEAPGGVGITASDSVGLFTVRFATVGAIGELSTVRITESPTLLEATRACAVVPAASLPGGVLLAAPGNPPRVSLERAGSLLSLGLQGPAGTLCQVEASDDLQEWAPVPDWGMIVLTGAPVVVELPQNREGQRYYRLVFGSPGPH